MAAVSQINSARPNDLANEEMPTEAVADVNEIAQGRAPSSQDGKDSLHGTSTEESRPATDRVGQNSKKKRIGKGLSSRMRFFKNALYPVAFAYNKMVGLPSFSKVKIYRQHLPKFFAVPKNRKREVMPFIRKHTLSLKNGQMVVAVKDLKTCMDSKAWYAKQKGRLDKELTALKLTEATISELDALSSQEFGRYLLEAWDSGMRKAEEEIEWQLKVRGVGREDKDQNKK